METAGHSARVTAAIAHAVAAIMGQQLLQARQHQRCSIGKRAQNAMTKHHGS
jgi:hypothetical protein